MLWALRLRSCRNGQQRYDSSVFSVLFRLFYVSQSVLLTTMYELSSELHGELHPPLSTGKSNDFLTSCPAAQGKARGLRIIIDIQFHDGFSTEADI